MRGVGALFLLLTVGSQLLSDNGASAIDTSCYSLGRISLVVKGGVCTGQAQVSCEATSRQKVVVDHAINTIYTKNPCEPATITSAARSIATAIASVWSQALIKVRCTGSHVKSSGCGFGISRGDALSVAWTEAIAVSVAAAEAEGNFGLCVADLRAMAPALAKAFADVQNSLCFTAKSQISAVAFSRAASNAVASVVGEAFSSATAEFCGKKVSSKCSGEARSSTPASTGTSTEGAGGVFIDPNQGSGIAIADGGGSAQGPSGLECKGPILACCSATSYPCQCTGCPDIVMFERAEITPSGLQKHLSMGGAHCFCY